MFLLILLASQLALRFDFSCNVLCDRDKYLSVTAWAIHWCNRENTVIFKIKHNPDSDNKWNWNNLSDFDCGLVPTHSHTDTCMCVDEVQHLSIIDSSFIQYGKKKRQNCQQCVWSCSRPAESSSTCSLSCSATCTFYGSRVRLSGRRQLSATTVASSSHHTGPGDEHRLRTAIWRRLYLFKGPDPVMSRKCGRMGLWD